MKSIFNTSIFACFFIFSTMAQANESDGKSVLVNESAQKAIQRFDQALEMIQKNKLAEAKDVLLGLIEDYPELPEPYINVAVIEAKQGKYFSAADTIYKAADMHKGNNTLQENSKKLDNYISALPTTDPALLEESKSIEALVENWRKSWSNQNLATYLTYYGDKFVPSKGLTKEQWAKQRKDRLETPPYINIASEQLKIKFQSGRLAVISFKQTYSTPSVRSIDFKKIILGRVDGKWVILKEDAYPFRSSKN